MSKTVEKALLSQNWAHKMFYVMLHDHFKELQKYRNLQFLVKISPKITFYIVREYYIITIYIFTKEIYHNMQYEINGSWMTCAQIYEHPFIAYIKLVKSDATKLESQILVLVIKRLLYSLK